jgi:hypothetical protein
MRAEALDAQFAEPADSSVTGVSPGRLRLPMNIQTPGREDQPGDPIAAKAAWLAGRGQALAQLQAVLEGQQQDAGHDQAGRAVAALGGQAQREGQQRQERQEGGPGQAAVELGQQRGRGTTGWGCRPAGPVRPGSARARRRRGAQQGRRAGQGRWW